jgi:hypothetical protein
VKLGIVAENIGKLGLAVATICFVAQTIIWLVSMGQEVRCFAGCRPRYIPRRP